MKNEKLIKEDLRVAIDAFSLVVPKEYRMYPMSKHPLQVRSKQSYKDAKSVLDAAWVKYFDIDELILDTTP